MDDHSPAAASFDKNAHTSQTNDLTPGSSRSNSVSVEVRKAHHERSLKRPRKRKHLDGPGAAILDTPSQIQADAGSQHRAPTSILASLHDVLDGASAGSAPSGPRDALRPASATPFFAQEPFNELLPSDFPFDPRETLHPTSPAPCLALSQSTSNQLLPSNFPFDPREALHPSSIPHFPIRDDTMSPEPGHGSGTEDRHINTSDPFIHDLRLSGIVHQAPAAAFSRDEPRFSERQSILSSISPRSECQAF